MLVGLLRVDVGWILGWREAVRRFFGGDRLLYVTWVRPEVGEISQDYRRRYRVTRVEKYGAGCWKAYGKDVGPSSGPGTEVGG